MPNLNTVNSNFYKIAVVDGSDNVVGITAAPANVKITGSSSAGQTLTADGSGGLAWAAASSSAVTGQYELFASAPPDSTWLVAGTGPYSSTTYPALANLYAGGTGTAAAGGSYPAGVSTASMAFGGGRYVRIATTNQVTYSTDGGTTWVAGGTLPVATGGSWAPWLTWNGSVFFTVYYTNNSTIGATSPDGVTWTQRTLPTPTGSGYYGVASLGSTLCAMQYSATTGGSRGAISTDNGATWTSTTLPFSTTDFVAAGGGKFVTAVYGGNQGAYSTDGTTWTTFTLPATTNWEHAVWTGTYWLMGSAAAISTMAMSFNGITWFSVTNPAGSVATMRLFWNGKYVLQPDGTNNRVWFYADPRYTSNAVGSVSNNVWCAVDTSVTNKFVRDLNTQSTTVTIAAATTFTAGTNPGIATSSGTWWIKS